MSKNHLLLLILTVLIISSCRSYRHIYSPQPPNNPIFREKGETELAILYSGADGNNGIGQRQQNEGIDIQAAYAFANHWAVTGSYYFRAEKDEYFDPVHNDIFNTSVVDYKRNLADLGIGYFIPLSEKKKTTFSFYTGLGFGKFHFNDHGLDDTLASYTRFYEANMSKWSLQPGFNFWVGSDFIFSITCRYSFMHFYNNATNYNLREQTYFALQKINSKTLSTFEPTFSMIFGIPSAKWVKLHASTTFTSGWASIIHENAYPSTRSVNGSIGLVFDFSKLKQKEPAK